MIDFHSHILPGIDDGSRNLETTKLMLEQMQHQGVQAVVATSHFIGTKDYPDRFLEKRAEALAQVATLEGEFPKIIPGAEIEYFFGMGACGVLDKLQLGDSGLVLIEMPFSPWSSRMVQEICDLEADTGLIPVLAHVDRYRQYNQMGRFMKTFQDAGVLFQCNSAAFFTFASRRWALKMIKKGYIHFLGTDTHNMAGRPPNLPQAMEIIEKKLGKEPLETIEAFTRKMLKL